MRDFWFPDEESWRCRMHPSPQPRTGVCPACLRQRLLRLCPDCACDLPCGCPASSSSSLSSSSGTTSSSSLSILLSADPPNGSGGDAASIGVVGRVASLIESEPAFRRSRSTAFHLLRPRADGERDGRARVGKGWGMLWPFKFSRKVKAEGADLPPKAEEKATRVAEVAAAMRLNRSRSVGFDRQEAAPVPPRYSHSSDCGGFISGGGGGGRGGPAADGKWKGWNWYFPSPMKPFGHRSGRPSSAARAVVHERSPICRG